MSAAIERRLKVNWPDALVAETHSGATGWPYSFPIGRASSAQLAGAFGGVPKFVTDWRSWAAAHDVELLEERRRISGTEQTLPTHIRVATLDGAAAVVGGDWPATIERGRRRAVELANRFPDLERPRHVVTATVDWEDLDFALLLETVGWFRSSLPDERARLTPRQVPVEGIHAKWLNTRRRLVAEMAGLDDLGLLPDHPARIHFTYLDPDYLAEGARRHDSLSVGDTSELPYEPAIVLISENKDTAVGFPPLPKGIAVEGEGRGASTHARIDFIANAPLVVYWGDMDADGLEILNEFRGVGVAAQSVLMGLDAFEEWERFGTNRDQHGKDLGARAPRPVDHLTEDEHALYSSLVSRDWRRFRRIEQERIPLAVAHEAVMQLLQHAVEAYPEFDGRD